MALTQVNSEGIKDGEIKDADVNASAAIAGSKLAAATTSAAGSMSAADKTKLDGVATSATANPSAPALTGSTNNTITTVTGANAIQGEANLTFDGSTLKLTADNGEFVVKNASNTDAISVDSDNGNTYIAGRVLVGTTTEGAATADELTIATSGSTGITLRSATDGEGNIFFSDGTSGNDEYRGMVRYEHANDEMVFKVDTAERIRVKASDTNILFSSDNSTVAEGLFLNNTAGNTGDNVSIAFSTDSGNRKKSAISHVDTGNYGRGDLVVSIDPDADSGSLDVQAHEKVRFQSAGGISFNGDSTQANALDDYEEGSFTTSIGMTTTQVTISGTSSWTGYYVKVGTLCHFHVYISGVDVTDNGAGWMYFSGLPFTSHNGTYVAISITHNTLTAHSVKNGYVQPGNTIMYPVQDDSTSATYTQTGSTRYLMFGGTYRTA